MIVVVESYVCLVNTLHYEVIVNPHHLGVYREFEL